MAVNKISLRVKSNKQLVKKSQEDLRAQVPLVAKSRLRAATQDLKNRMSKAGKKIKYPVQWDSEKQKWYVIFMLKSKKRLPYRRTKKNQQGWKIVPLKSGYTLENRVRGSVYVYGDVRGAKQSRIHQNRWPHLRTQADYVIKPLPKGMRKAMVELADKVTRTSKGTVR